VLLVYNIRIRLIVNRLCSVSPAVTLRDQDTLVTAVSRLWFMWYVNRSAIFFSSRTRLLSSEEQKSCKIEKC